MENMFSDKKDKLEMAVNLELKIKLESKSDIIELLDKIGAEKTEILNQKDVYYENKIGLIKLRIENGKHKLIQYLREEECKDRWSHYEILNISDENAEDFLSKIFKVETKVVKVRQLYLYKNTRIHLDAVEKLGDYLELETVVHIDRDSSKLEFDEVVNLLKLDISKQIKKSYKNLIEEL
ncbi:MAG: CYTH domain-containing protein [Melioribacteraceae bacterium]|nr:CYTH domain-containing protein [Melioribacteraceae bacterium]